MRILIANSNIPAGDGVAGTQKAAWKVAATNLGHMLIGERLQSMLRQHELNAIPNIWDADSWRRPMMAGEYDGFDVVLISLQDLIRGALPQPLFDYGALRDFADRVRGRVVVVGLGANSLDETPRQLAAAMLAPVRETVLRLCDRADAIGVRGAFTAEVLESLGVKSVDPIGCPTFFDRADEVQASSFALRRDAYAYGGDFIPATFDWARDYFVVQDELPALRALAPDEFLVEEEGAWYQQDPAWRDPLVPKLRELANRGRAVAFPTPAAWSAFLAEHVGAVVGGRLHGGVAALAEGVPLLLTNPDARTREFAELMGFPYAPQVKTDGPRELFADLLDMSGFLQRYPGRARAFEDFFNRSGVSLLLSSPGSPGGAGP